MNTKEGEDVNVHLFLSARDMTILPPIIISSYEGTDQSPHTDDRNPKPNPKVYLNVDILYPTFNPVANVDVPSSMLVQRHAQRLEVPYIKAHKEDVGRDVYVCGPDDYTQMIARAIQQIGVQPGRIRSERLLTKTWSVIRYHPDRKSVV